MATHGTRGRGPQQGFALLELSVALLIGTLLLVWGSAALMRRADDAAAQASGAWLLEIRHAAYRMLERHFDKLAEGGVPVGATGTPLYADLHAPTLAEFKAQGLLPSGFPETAPAGGSAQVRLLAPSGCPGSACRVDALVYASRPLSDAQGRPDMMRMALLTEAAGGYGGYATAGPASRLRGGTFDFPNPYAPGAGALPAGTPVLWAGMDLATAAQYVRRFDERDPELKGALTVDGGISSPGQITGGRLQAREYLQISGLASPGGECDPNGLVGRTAEGVLLSCQSGRWQHAGSRRICNADGCALILADGSMLSWGIVGMPAGGRAIAFPVPYSMIPSVSVNECDATNAAWPGRQPTAFGSGNVTPSGFFLYGLQWQAPGWIQHFITVCWQAMG